MSGYKELREGYEFTRATQGSSGTRVFIDQTGGTDSLPSLGDAFSVSYPNVKCTSVQEVLYHVEGTTDKKKYVCQYSTTNTTITVHRKDRTDEDNFVNSGGAELVSIENPKEWYWMPEPWVDATTEGLYKGRMFKNTIRGALSKTIILDKEGDHSYANFMSEQVLPKVGKINSVALTSANWSLAFNKGTVLFTNWDSALVTNEDGDDKWEVTLNFAYRILQVPEAANQMGADATGSNIDYSWNWYLYPDAKVSPGHPDWQMVTNTKGSGGAPNFDSNFVYLTVDFMSNSANFTDILGGEA